MSHKVRVVLPTHLRALAQVGSEISVEIRSARVTLRAVLDAIEMQYPMLRGTIRDHGTHKRRAFVRFYVCERDISHNSPDDLLPDRVVCGDEPLLVVGAMAGG